MNTKQTITLRLGMLGPKLTISSKMFESKENRKFMGTKSATQPGLKRRYWLAVVKSPENLVEFVKDPWWCLPSDVQQGDGVLLYVPRSAMKRIVGIFAESEVARVGPATTEEKMRCLWNAISDNARPALVFCKLKATEEFESPIPPAEIKKDTLLGLQSFTRKNFQGTVFETTKSVFLRVRALVDTQLPAQ